VSDPPVEDTAASTGEPTLYFELLADHHDVATFRCGATFLDWLLQHDAHLLADADVNRTFVLAEREAAATENGKTPIEGYFTLEAGVAPTAFVSLLPEDTLSALIAARDAFSTPPPCRLSPLTEIPVVYLAYLARDRRNRGRGYGDLLLIEALRQAELASRHIGAAGVFLVSTGEGERLYTDYGFRPYGDYDRKMFLSMRAIREALALLTL